MKCLCGYEGGEHNFIPFCEVEYQLVRKVTKEPIGGKVRTYHEKIRCPEIIRACPRCGTLKIKIYDNKGNVIEEEG